MMREFSVLFYFSIFQLDDGIAHHSKEGETKGKRVKNFDIGTGQCRVKMIEFYFFKPNCFEFVSKTTIMKRVLGEDHHEISPTVGFNIKTLEYNDFVLNLWDVGGQKSIRTYWRNYFEQTDGIIWVVDSVDRWRLEECRAQLRDLLSQEVFVKFDY